MLTTTQQFVFRARSTLQRAAATMMVTLAGHGCSIDVGDDRARARESALVVGGTTRLHSLASPVAIHAAAVGLSSAAYGDEWSRLTGLGYVPISLTGTTLPDGSIRYSSAFHKDRSIIGFYSWRGLTEADYSTKWTEYRDGGFRVLDVVAHSTSAGMRYDGVWVRERTPKSWASRRDMSLSSLNTRLSEYQAQGYRPIRLHGYQNGSSTQYSGVWVRDILGTNYRVILDQPSGEYGEQFDANVAAGFLPIDLSAYPVGSQVRYTGIFVKDPSVTHYQSWRGQTLEEFLAKQRDYAEGNYVMVDAEHYSTSATSNLPRYAGIWLRRSNSNVVSNMSLTSGDVAGWNTAARDALTRLRNRVAGYSANVGFIVEDLTNGNWIGYRIHEPFYMASTTKVMIAAAVLDRVAAGALNLNGALAYAAGDILEVNDNPTYAHATDHTVLESLQWMIDQSSTNATDRLLDLVDVNAFVEDNGLVDLGEITSICELDRRILAQQDACAEQLTCFELERWLRASQNPTNATSRACTDGLARNDDASFEAYYATLANSITPLQYGRVWRSMLDATALTPAMRDQLVTILAGTGQSYMTSLPGTFFDVRGGKFGAKREVDCYVGVGYDTVAAQPGVVDDRAQYAFALFTEDWNASAANQTAAQALINNLASDALTVLRNRR